MPPFKLDEYLWCFMCGTKNWSGDRCYNPLCGHIDSYLHKEVIDADI